MCVKWLSKHGGNGNIGNRLVPALPTMSTHRGFDNSGSKSCPEAPDGYNGQVTFVAAANAIADPNLLVTINARYGAMHSSINATCKQETPIPLRGPLHLLPDQAEDKQHLPHVS